MTVKSNPLYMHVILPHLTPAMEATGVDYVSFENMENVYIIALQIPDMPSQKM